MTGPLLYGLAGLALFCISLRAVLLARDPVRVILAVNVMSSSVFLCLIALANRSPGWASDPVTHAMVITGIVVAVSATALAIVLARRLEATSEPRPADEAARTDS